MYKKILFFAFFAATVLFGACSSSDDEPSDPNRQEVDLSKLTPDQRKEYEEAQKYLEPFGYKNTSIRFLHVYEGQKSYTQLSGVKEGKLWTLFVDSDGNRVLELTNPEFFSDETSYENEQGTKTSKVTDITSGTFSTVSSADYAVGIARFKYVMSNGDTPFAALYNSKEGDMIYLRPLVAQSPLTRLGIGETYIFGRALYNDKGLMIYYFNENYPPLKTAYENFFSSSLRDGVLTRLESIRVEADGRLLRFEHVTQNVVWQIDWVKLFDGATEVIRDGFSISNEKEIYYYFKVVKDGGTTRWRVGFDKETGQETERKQMPY